MMQIKIDYLRIAGTRVPIMKTVDLSKGEVLALVCSNPATGLEHILYIDQDDIMKAVVNPTPMCRTEVPRDQIDSPKP